MHSELFYNYLQNEKRFSTHTVTAYKTDLEQYLDFAKSTDASFTNTFIVRSWLVQLLDSNLDPRSVNRKISTLKTYFKFLMREKLLDQNPMLKVQSPKQAKKLPEILREESVVTLLENDTFFIDEFESVRDKLVIELLFGTGIRLAELIGINETDLNYYQSTVKVLGKRSKERLVPLHKELIMLCEAYLKLKKNKTFKHNSEKLIVTNTGADVYPKLIYRTVQQYLSHITTQKKKSPHVLRHTFATSLLNNGADLNAIKELLGHANLGATQIYTHNSVEKLKSIYKQAHPKA